MGKTSASIKLIQILTARKDFISTDELAEMLDTNKRNIREYVQEIEEAGYFVESKRGLTGGYRLLNRSTLPATNLTDDEIKALKDSTDFLKENNFESIDEYNNAISKVLSSVNYDDMSLDAVYEKFPLAIPKKELMDRYQTVADAIEDQYKCDMHYKSSKNVSHSFVFFGLELLSINFASFWI